MFTGLVAERGRVLGDPSPAPGGGVTLTVGHSAELGERLSLGASLAVCGVCLTVIETAPDGTASTVEMGGETLARTTLGALRDGSVVNLETPLRMGDPLGGHWVQGHVDTTVEVVERTDHAEHTVMAFSLPAAVAPYVVEKGSVALDGVSLTVTGVTGPTDPTDRGDESGAGVPKDGRFGVWLIPHTLAVTTLGLRQVGDRVNLEVDILAKYVERGLQAYGRPDPAGAER